MLFNIQNITVLVFPYLSKYVCLCVFIHNSIRILIVFFSPLPCIISLLLFMTTKEHKLQSFLFYFFYKEETSTVEPLFFLVSLQI